MNAGDGEGQEHSGRVGRAEQEQEQGGITKDHEETLGSDGYVDYLDYGSHGWGYIFQNISNYRQSCAAK